MPGKQTCAHDGCPSELPLDEGKIPPGWTVVRADKYTKQSIVTTYYYVCPDHRITTTLAQSSLFEGATP